MAFQGRKRSNDSYISGGLVQCQECGTRLYPCEKTLNVVKQELKEYMQHLLEQKMTKMFETIDESIGIEEVLDVHSPDIIETRYKNPNTDGQRLWNMALCKCKIDI